MRYQFEKIIERPEWTATVQIHYYPRIPKVSSYTDGRPAKIQSRVQGFGWGILEVHRSVDQANATIAMDVVGSQLALEGAAFESQIRLWCEQDLERRDSGEASDDEP